MLASSSPFTSVHFWRARFDFDPQQYVAGIMEEDDPSVPQLIKTPAGPGRHFTLYLYDREKNHVCGPHGSLVASPCATTVLLGHLRSVRG